LYNAECVAILRSLMLVTPVQAKAAASLMKKGDSEQRRAAAKIVALWQSQQGKQKSKFPRKR